MMAESRVHMRFILAENGRFQAVIVDFALIRQVLPTKLNFYKPYTTLSETLKNAIKEYFFSLAEFQPIWLKINLEMADLSKIHLATLLLATSLQYVFKKT